MISVLLIAAAGDAPTLIVRSYVRDFAKFYRDSMVNRLSEQRRWDLWQKEYGIAAVPPTTEGKVIARRQLDSAWPKYPGLLQTLDEKTRAAQSTANELLPRISSLLTDDSHAIAVRLVLYVGQFDYNSFAYWDHRTQTGTAFVAVEIPNIRATLAHELTHAVHYEVAHVRAGYAAPLAETALLEGVAMRSSQQLVPGETEETYTGGDAQWLQDCHAKAGAVIAGVLSQAAVADPAVTSKFTYGTGSAGMHREVYCAGWLLVGDLLLRGWTFRRIAAVQENQMVGFASEKMRGMLAALSAKENSRRR